jgi:hypothetical protein
MKGAFPGASNSCSGPRRAAVVKPSHWSSDPKITMRIDCRKGSRAKVNAYSSFVGESRGPRWRTAATFSDASSFRSCENALTEE